MLRRTVIVAVTLFWTMASCTDRPPSPSLTAPAAGNRPPTVLSARFLKDPLLSTEEAAVQVIAEDPDHEAVTLSYQWYVEGVPMVGETGPTLSPTKFRRGQRVSVEITPADAKQKGPVYRLSPTVVVNSPPVIHSVTIARQDTVPANRIEASVDVSDADRDPLTLTFQWYRNQVLVKEGEEAFLETEGVVAGDLVTVEVTARDPSGAESVARSAPWMMENRPPRIVSIPPVPQSTDFYTYKVQAIDDDGDQLKYMLQTAPRGMTIGEDGRIDWRVPHDHLGVHHVTILVTDGRGGIASQEFDLQLIPQSPAHQVGT
ncbi:MAG: hypothetical protein NNA18_03720 [Nitrospira sp.]|nr:hypothetical protein [Nitrospira sp.]